jgi:hypothetical protein
MTERKERLLNAYHDGAGNLINKVSVNETTIIKFSQEIDQELGNSPSSITAHGNLVRK